MADTTYGYTPGAGALAAIDRVSGTDYPYYKIKWGTPGALNDASAGTPLPVGIVGTPAVSGTVTANAGTGTFNSELGQLFGVAPTGAHKTPSLVIRGDTPSIPHANGTYTYLQVDAAGKLWVNAATQVVQLGGRGADTASVQRMAIVDEQLGSLVLGSVPVITGGSDWYYFAPSTGFTTIQSATGAAGDYLEAVHAVVTTPATSVITVRDGPGGPSRDIFPNGVGGVGAYPLALGWRSKLGGWQISTGAGVAIFASGKFS